MLSRFHLKTYLFVAGIVFGSYGTGYAQSSTETAGANNNPPPIPRATFIHNMEAEFRSMDVNHDSLLSSSEIESFQRASATARNAEQARTLFAQLDTDHNGQLSPVEFARIPLPSPKADPWPMLKRFDSNKDEAISLIEYRGGTLVNFDRLDVDKDGIVSPTEMRAVGIGQGRR